jgi:hypothetical protein
MKRGVKQRSKNTMFWKRGARESGYQTAGLLLILALLLAACGNTDTEPATSADTGTLQFRANGEDFIRQGFVTKDGWNIAFDHVYVTLADLTAYQADPPYDAQEDGEIAATTTATLEGTHTVDLAAGDADAAPVLVGEVTAPAGRYNALSWRMVEAADGPASGAVILMQGTAEKAGEQVAFSIALDQESAHTCGDYVGDERKGLLEANATADVEATFHFDHIFGDADLPPDDALNSGALGFAPLAALAEQGALDVDMAALETGLSPVAYATLTGAHLAHVGEGHCTSEAPTAGESG